MGEQLDDQGAKGVGGEGNELAEGKPEWPLEMTPRESLTQLNFWLLFFIFGVGSACGLLFLNNAGTYLPFLVSNLRQHTG